MENELVLSQEYFFRLARKISMTHRFVRNYRLFIDLIILVIPSDQKYNVNGITNDVQLKNVTCKQVQKNKSTKSLADFLLNVLLGTVKNSQTSNFRSIVKQPTKTCYFDLTWLQCKSFPPAIFKLFSTQDDYCS